MNRIYSIIHIGPLPPPIGGISIYLTRLKNIETTASFIDESSLSKIDFLKLAFLKNKHFFYHSPNLKKRLFFYFVSLFTSNTFSFASHGDGLMDSYLESNYFVKMLIVKMIQRAEEIQCVNSRIKDFILSICDVRSDKLVVKPAFLPPNENDEESIYSTYSSELICFLDEHHPTVVGNASALVFHKGIDLYGLDMCIDLIHKLKEEYPHIGLVFALADETVNADYFQKMKDRVKSLGLENNVYFMTGQKELWPLFKKADLMVRPTSSDGYGVSIAEALHFGCPAVASDVCDRPEGTVLFKSRNPDCLCEVCCSILRRNTNEL